MAGISERGKCKRGNSMRPRTQVPFARREPGRYGTRGGISDASPTENSIVGTGEPPAIRAEGPR
jgi:hypothetical protein